jgi:phosphocarrier protein
MPETTAVVASASGLHARPASVFVEAAQRYGSTIRLSVDDRGPVDAKSILMVMGIGAGQGATVRLSAEGDDADAALAELVQLVETDHD